MLFYSFIFGEGARDFTQSTQRGQRRKVKKARKEDFDI